MHDETVTIGASFTEEKRPEREPYARRPIVDGCSVKAKGVVIEALALETSKMHLRVFVRKDENEQITISFTLAPPDK